MTRTFFKTAAVAIALSAVTILPAVPAYAGSLAISIAPQDAEQEQAMRAGLLIFGLVKGAQSGGLISQNGSNNSGGIAQNGADNYGIVHQEGNGHNGSLQQNGNNNAHGLFQFGENSDGHVVQNGNGGTGATFVFGW